MLIDQLLSYLKPKGHKVLMFSQMTHMLDILQDYLGYRGMFFTSQDDYVWVRERGRETRHDRERILILPFLQAAATSDWTALSEGRRDTLPSKTSTKMMKHSYFS